MNFTQFDKFFVHRLKKVFFNTTALRLAICHSIPSQTGKRLSISYACCVILEFLTDAEKVKA